MSIMWKYFALQSMKREETYLEAIQNKCLDCCCNDKEEVENCTVKDCPLWKYRIEGIKKWYK